jgi:CRP-like cAMP-binding protein
LKKATTSPASPADSRKKDSDSESGGSAEDEGKEDGEEPEADSKAQNIIKATMTKVTVHRAASMLVRGVKSFKGRNRGEAKKQLQRELTDAIEKFGERDDSDTGSEASTESKQGYKEYKSKSFTIPLPNQPPLRVSFGLAAKLMAKYPNEKARLQYLTVRRLTMSLSRRMDLREMIKSCSVFKWSPELLDPVVDAMHEVYVGPDIDLGTFDCFGVLLSGSTPEVGVGVPFGMHIFGVAQEKKHIITETPCVCALLHKDDFLGGQGGLGGSEVAQKLMNEDSDLLSALKGLDVAKVLSREFLQAVARATEHMSIASGTTLFEAGHAATSALIILKGHAEVVRQGKVDGVIETGASIGMKSLLGLEQDRKCTVRTLSPCLVAYVQQIAFFVILGNFPKDSQRLKTHCARLLKDKDKDKNDGRVEEFAKKSMFKHCTAGFAEAVLTQMTTQMFYPGQDIVREGMMGDSYYFIQVGKAHAYVNDMLVDTYESAGGIGELNILGASIAYKVTVRTLEVCYVLVLSRDALLSTLQRHPVERAGWLNVAKSIEQQYGKRLDSPFLIW